ncbi:MAG: superoxide dismutase family protein [Cyclobacteriaceae bacterium]
MKQLSILSILILAACSQSENPEFIEPEFEAVAGIYSLELVQEGKYNIKSRSIGYASFSQTGEVVTLEIELKGMTPNSSKAVHIHNGSITTPGRHWNQHSFYAFCNEKSLGELWEKPFAGDIGNVPIDANGNGKLILQTDFWALNSGDEKDILDKILIVHEDPEDFAEECDPAHSHDHLHSNLKIGGGQITLTSDVEQKNQQIMTRFPDFTVCK